MCSRRQAFDSNFAVYRFAVSGDEFELDLVREWFTPAQVKNLKSWIDTMLRVEPSERPSATCLRSSLGELLVALDLKGTHPFISVLLSENTQSLDSGVSLLRSTSILGTHYMPSFNFEMRWEEVLALGSIEQHERTLQRYKSFVNARRTLFSINSPYTLGIMATFGWAAFYLQRDIESASSLFEEITAALKRIHGPEHPAYLTSLSAIAWCLVSQGRDKDGPDTFAELVPKLRELLSSRYPTMLSCEYGLSVVMCNLDQSADGAKVLESTLALQRSMLGDAHTCTILTMSGLAWAYVELRRLEEAQALYDEASAKQISLLGVDHIEAISSTSGKAWLMYLRGSPTAALPIFEDVVERQARLLGIHHSDTHDSICGLEQVYTKLGDKVKARELRRLHVSCGWSKRNPARRLTDH